MHVTTSHPQRPGLLRLQAASETWVRSKHCCFLAQGVGSWGSGEVTLHQHTWPSPGGARQQNERSLLLPPAQTPAEENSSQKEVNKLL